MLYKLALTKVTVTDDASPTGSPATQFDIADHHDRPGKMPTGALALFIEFLDVGGNEVAGASCSARLWLQDARSSKWYRVDAKKSGITGRSATAFAFPPLNSAAKAYLQISDVAGTGITSIKAYVAETANYLPIDPSTGALRVADILQRGGEQNAIAAHMTAHRALQSADGACSWDNSAAAEASSVTKAGPGCLYGFAIHNANAAARFLQFFDSVTVPADTAVPVLSIAIPATTTRVERVPFDRRFFATGICWALSTTAATKTLAAADAFGAVAYG